METYLSDFIENRKNKYYNIIALVFCWCNYFFRDKLKNRYILYVGGKYRDVILPMTVIRRLDAVLEPTKEAVLDLKKLKNQRYLDYKILY